VTTSPITLSARLAAAQPERVEVFYRAPVPVDPEVRGTWLLRRNGADVRLFRELVHAEKWAEANYGCWTWGYAYPGHYVAIATT